jgi:hypothetical protein
VIVYVDDLNMIGSPSLYKHTKTLLTIQFDMKLLGKTSFYLGLYIQHFPNGIFLYQQAYIRKLLQYFQMDQADVLAASIIGRSCSDDDRY